MAKVILQISYEIQDDKRQEYLALTQALKHHFIVEQQKNYSIYEQRGKHNNFVEQFVCNSEEEYETLEDNMTDSSTELINKLENLVKQGTTKYTTLIEI
ncbi:MAG: MFS transporter [Bacteroidetes bacterium]|nr:MFS transporter [Bacteroidota bacterium]